MQKILLNGQKGKNKFAIVDDEDYEWLNQYRWYCNNRGYAVRFIKINSKTKCILMHRMILNLTNPKDITDHKNRNILDNRKINIRKCIQQENARNKMYHKNKRKSTFKGVTISNRKDGSKFYIAAIKLNNTRQYLGSFKIELMAALAYDVAARQHYGEFACINFPEKLVYSNIDDGKLNRTQTSSCGGVYLHKASNKWMVRCKLNNKRIYVGRYDTEKEAIQAKIHFMIANGL